MRTWCEDPSDASGLLTPPAFILRSVISRVQHYAKAGQGQRVQQCRALELQIWGTLPSFASWCRDLPEGLKAFAKEIGLAFQNRADLRPAICLALERMCLQAREAVTFFGAAAQYELDGAHPLAQGDDDEADEEGAGASGRLLDEGHDKVPEWLQLDQALTGLQALRALSRNFLPVLFNAFVATKPEARGYIGRAIAAYALVAGREPVAAAFKTVVQKLVRLAKEASNPEEMSEPPILEGGDSVGQRRATFMELALCLAGGLDDQTLGKRLTLLRCATYSRAHHLLFLGHAETLFLAAGPCLTDPEPAVQKKGYKLMGYILENRRAFVASRVREMVELVLAGTQKCSSAAKRYRLRCTKALVLLLASSEEAEGLLPSSSGSAGEAVKTVVSQLISEIVLCTKESNKRARAAAYDLLIEIGRRFQDLEDEAQEAEMASAGASLGTGGLHQYLSLLLAGLAGTHPHMLSATVMALARVLYEFAPSLAERTLPELLPAVLLLLRTKSREVVKSVLGFVKVASMRLPAEELTKYLGPMLEGMLIWAEDSKNKFRQKVRVVVERLARRCGFDAVSAAMPESDSRLLTHIRKEHNRKLKRKHGDMEVDEDEDGEDGDRRSMGGRSSMARTARASEWGHTQIFSDSEDEEEDRKSRKTARTKAGKSAAGAVGQGARLVDRADADPMDLLDAGASRRLVKASARARGDTRDQEQAATYERASDGRIVILDEEKAAAAKRRRVGGAEDSEDEDSELEELFGDRRPGKAKSVGGQSLRSLGGKSTRTMGGRSAGASTKGGRSQGGKSRFEQHSGDRFQSRKAQGDVKGKQKVEPYAYWPLDRKMLNKRSAKKRAAEKGLEKVVRAVKGGVAKGLKAKRQAKGRK